MNEKLIVKNFGPIKDAELDLKKVTVFIGPQGSGKSTLAKLVAIFNNGEFLIKTHLDINTGIFFKNYQIDYFLNEDTSIIYSTDDYKVNFYSRSSESVVTLQKKFTASFGNNWFQNNSFESLKLEWDKIKDSDEQNQRIRFSSYIGQFERKYNDLSVPTYYLPTERFFISSISDSILGLLSADVALQKSTIDFGRDFEIARSNIPTLFIDYLNITYKYENGRNLVFHSETDSLPLSASASGYQSTIPLHLNVEHFSREGDTYFIVEEPELNLFPTTQKQLVSYLVDKCTQNGNELLMTTHSPYVLSAINNLIFAYKVAHEVPEKAHEVEQIIPFEQWLNPKDVAAYYVGDGTVKSIIHEGEGLIGENELDAISEDISGERDLLFKILRSKKRETVH
jgi:predicted ATPase